MSDPGPAPCPPGVAYGPCAPYATADDVQACGGFGLTIGDADDDPVRLAVERALVWASRRVFEATGGQWWGCCEVTIRPCRSSECHYPAGWPAGIGWWPSIGGLYPPGPVPVAPWEYLPAIPFGLVTAAGETAFVNIWRCACAESEPCGCGAVGDRLTLPFGPVRDVLAVTIDGADFPRDGNWTVSTRGELVRIDGERWPRKQDTAKELTEVGTWAARILHGYDAPPELVPLVAGFGAELAKMCLGDACLLPAGFRVVQRDGVEFGVVEPAEYRAAGLTGFGPVDDWIMLMRGGHVPLHDAPRAYHPRMPLEVY